MLWLSILSICALALAVIARVVGPKMLNDSLQLDALRERTKQLYDQVEKMRGEVATVDALTRNALEASAALSMEVPRLERELNNLGNKPPFVAREIVADESDGAMIYIARLTPPPSFTRAGTWKFDNHLLIFAGSEDDARLAATAKYPSDQGWRLDFATQCPYSPSGNHLDRQIDFPSGRK